MKIVYNFVEGGSEEEILEDFESWGRSFRLFFEDKEEDDKKEKEAGSLVSLKKGEELCSPNGLELISELFSLASEPSLLAHLQVVVIIVDFEDVCVCLVKHEEVVLLVRDVVPAAVVHLL